MLEKELQESQQTSAGQRCSRGTWCKFVVRDERLLPVSRIKNFSGEMSAQQVSCTSRHNQQDTSHRQKELELLCGLSTQLVFCFAIIKRVFR